MDSPTSRAALPQSSGGFTLEPLWQRAWFPLVSPGLPMSTVKAAYKRAPVPPQPPDPTLRCGPTVHARLPAFSPF